MLVSVLSISSCFFRETISLLSKGGGVLSCFNGTYCGSEDIFPLIVRHLLLILAGILKEATSIDVIFQELFTTLSIS